MIKYPIQTGEKTWTIWDKTTPEFPHYTLDTHDMYDSENCRAQFLTSSKYPVPFCRSGAACKVIDWRADLLKIQYRIGGVCWVKSESLKFGAPII
jgi:hypothetical protein